MPKFMILTDSDGYPRSFPASEMFDLEETYPYLLRAYYKDSIFWQLSYGNVTTVQLLSQPIGYLTHWKPDIIIVQSGIADCRPEAFTEFQKEIINRATWKFFGRIKKYLYQPALIRRRQIYRVTPKVFKATIRKFKMVFPHSKILWLEISTEAKYEQVRPGVEKRKKDFNAIIKEVYGEDMVPVQQRLLDVEGFNALDHGHQNRRGHKAVAEVLIDRIDAYLKHKA